MNLPNLLGCEWDYMIQKMLKKLNRHSVFFRILLLYLISSCFILLLLSACLTHFLSEKAIEDSNRASQNSVEQSYAMLNYILTDIYNAYYNLFKDPAMPNILYSSGALTTADYQNIETLTADASVFSECVDSIYIVNNKAGFVYSLVSNDSRMTSVRDFFDLQALEIINISNINQEYLLYPRNLSYTIENKNFRKVYITLAFSLDNGGSLADGGLVINIDQQKLHALLNVQEDTDNLYIVNINGSIISCGDVTRLNTSFLNNNTHKVIYNIISASSKDENIFERTIGQETYLVNYKKSPVLKFMFLYIVPFSDIEEQVSYIKTLTVIITTIFMAISFLFAAMFSKVIYSPISRLVSNVKRNFDKPWQRGGRGVLSPMNEFDYLDTAYKQISDSIAEINSSLGSMEQSKNRETIQKFLNSEYHGLEEFQKVLSVQEKCFGKPYYCAVIFSLNESAASQAEAVKDLPLLKFAVYNIADEILGKACTAIGVVDKENLVSFVLNIDKAGKEALSELSNILSEIINLIFDSVNIRTSAAIGSFVQELMDVPQSYRNALTASQYLFTQAEMSILSFAQIARRHEEEYEYAYALEKNILNAMKNCNTENALIEIRKFFEEISCSSIENIRLSITQLMISLTRAAKSIENGEAFSEPMDYPKISAQVGACRSILEVEEVCCDFVVSRIDSRNSAILSKKSLQLEKACAYIKENYSNPLLSIDEIAAYAGLSEGYFRTLFKSSYDVSPLDYLTTYRIEMAKNLLETADMTAKDIAEKVGYTNSRYFYGIFKSKLGMTATEYRRAHKK